MDGGGGIVIGAEGIVILVESNDRQVVLVVTVTVTSTAATGLGLVVRFSLMPSLMPSSEFEEPRGDDERVASSAPALRPPRPAAALAAAAPPP